MTLRYIYFRYVVTVGDTVVHWFALLPLSKVAFLGSVQDLHLSLTFQKYACQVNMKLSTLVYSSALRRGQSHAVNAEPYRDATAGNSEENMQQRSLSNWSVDIQK